MSDVKDPAAVDTVTIEIDGESMAVPKGSMIIEAADRVGINIPRFCYHRKLSIAANCRMCLVDVEKAPKPLPACATPVMEGMKVFTQSKRAVDAQRGVMEFLLINHPLDCPICDQGGECELQDVAMGYGRSVSRFTERKRVVADENLGPLIATDMTRCIHCTRCVRFLDEIAGTNELGGMGRGETLKIATYIGRSMASELAGNIIDLCPVGALTNKVFRFEARAWELRSKDSLANHDCVGSNLHAHTRRGVIERTVPKENDAINESWLSDRDRYSHQGLESKDRAAAPMVRDGGSWRTVGWDDALSNAAAILKAADPDTLGFLLSPRASTEALYLAQKMARALGTNNVDHRLRERDFSDQDARPATPAVERELISLRQADAVLIVGANPRHDQPLVGHQLRQAWRGGADMFALNVLDFEFSFETAAKIVVPPSRLASSLEGLEAQHPDIFAALQGAQDALIVLGNDAARAPDAARLRHLARRLADAVGATLIAVPDQANSVGAWMVGAVPHRGPGGAALEAPGLNVSEMVTGAAKTFLLYDLEPRHDCALGARAQRHLAGAAGVVYLGGYVTDAIRDIADVILPIAVHPETDGTFVNLNGRVQTVAAAVPAPGDARQGWKVLRVLGNELGLSGFDYVRVQQIRDEISGLLDRAPGEAGSKTTEAPAFDYNVGKDQLELIARTPIYACDGVVRRASALQNTVLGESAHLGANAATVEQLGVAEGDEMTLRHGDLTVTLPLRVDVRVPDGAVYVPQGVAGTESVAELTAVSVSRS